MYVHIYRVNTIAVALGDLVVRHPNRLEPWTVSIFLFVEKAGHDTPTIRTFTLSALFG